MWDEDRQGHLDDLQRRAQQDTLTDDEQRVLEQLLSELEQAEWTTLRLALDQQRREQGQLQPRPDTQRGSGGPGGTACRFARTRQTTTSRHHQ